MQPGQSRVYSLHARRTPPNPIGLHAVEITAIETGRVGVRHLEALNNTPILDVKPILSGNVSER
jgi:tRNA (Thr-GGU) A37 N-methylase